MGGRKHDKRNRKACKDACETHFAAFQKFMQLTGGDIGLSLQLTSNYIATLLRTIQMQEQDKKEKKKMQLLLETDFKGLLN